MNKALNQLLLPTFVPRAGEQYVRKDYNEKFSDYISFIIFISNKFIFTRECYLFQIGS